MEDLFEKERLYREKKGLWEKRRKSSQVKKEEIILTSKKKEETKKYKFSSVVHLRDNLKPKY